MCHRVSQGRLGRRSITERVRGLFLCKSCVTWAVSSFSGHGIHLGLGHRLQFFTFDGVLPCSAAPVSGLFSNMTPSLFVLLPQQISAPNTQKKKKAL